MAKRTHHDSLVNWPLDHTLEARQQSMGLQLHRDEMLLLVWGAQRGLLRAIEGGDGEEIKAARGCFALIYAGWVNARLEVEMNYDGQGYRRDLVECGLEAGPDAFLDEVAPHLRHYIVPRAEKAEGQGEE